MDGEIGALASLLEDVAERFQGLFEVAPLHAGHFICYKRACKVPMAIEPL
ncbi:MAG: hypothetical protein IT384_03880 [Deltaproteobacteria bacterium]|nr:hypothetical protein [Deltaproteobacteria bacterium]